MSMVEILAWEHTVTLLALYTHCTGDSHHVLPDAGAVDLRHPARQVLQHLVLAAPPRLPGHWGHTFVV